MRYSLHFVLPIVSLAAVACSPSIDVTTTRSSENSLAGTCATPPDPERSLFVRDATALAAFPMKSVLAQIAATGSTTGQTGRQVYQQMMDTMHKKAQGTTSGPHCDDVLVNGVPSINGFPIQCPRPEGDLSTTDPFGAGNDGYIPIGIVNRFDLAPKSGANCGQHRVVYGKRSGVGSQFDRVLIIFEAVLPNPNPTAGITACLPVAQFWDDLTNDNDAASRANKLKSFFFTGLPGFAPVIDAAHYGFGGGTNTGQIRANLFHNVGGSAPWQLREFRLSQTCNGTGCTLIANNTSVATNPFGALFGGNDAQAQDFQSNFLGQVQRLAAKQPANISMTTRAVDNAGQSNEQDQTNDYLFQGQNNTAFLNAITAKLASIGRSDLTAQNILDRATTQSCAGCHEVSNGRQLGPGTTTTWPRSNGFTQIDENSRLSVALTDTFLPARAKVLQNFINQNCPGQIPVDGGDQTGTLGGSDVGAAN